MESCREKTVGSRQVANPFKIGQLFELRCLTAYEYALISLQPYNPIHIMLCLKKRLLGTHSDSSPGWEISAESNKMRRTLELLAG